MATLIRQRSRSLFHKRSFLGSIAHSPKFLSSKVVGMNGNEEPPLDFPSDIEQLKRLKKASNNHKRDQTKHAFRPKIDPKETSILLFPGQGSQYVGMVKKILQYPNVKETFEYSSEVLGYNLLDICMFGPKEKLDKTVYCQPAIVVTSLAYVEKLREEQPGAIEKCIAAAGFSVGEISALTFAGVISLEEALKLVKARAEAMQEASEMQPGGMLTVMLSHQHKLKQACIAAQEHCKLKHRIERPVCTVANYLFSDCKVVAGHQEALLFLERQSKLYGIRRTKRLPVSGAFHTSLMQPAIPKFRKVLKEIEFEDPLISVHSNVTSHKYKNKSYFVKLLTEQIANPVKWEQINHVLYQRPQGMAFPSTYEMGPGSQLGVILQKNNLPAYKHYHALDT